MNCKSLFITVSYNNIKATICYIHSWLELNDSEQNILIVVDNSTEQDTLLKSMLEKYNHIHYVRQGSNKGYMSGCNFGLAYAKNMLNVIPETIIYTNNDITFETSDLISQVVNIFKNDPEVAVVAPAVWDVNEKKELNPFMLNRPALKHFIIMKAIYSNFITAKIGDWISKHRPRKKKIIPVKGCELYAPHGSIFILKGDYFYDDLPDDAYFLYGEEISIAERCLKMGKKVKMFPNIIIHHHSHSTTGASLSYFTYKAKKKAISYLLKQYAWK
ncbi:TPA: glycosyltransferase family 2 protein [Escherichia coli]